MSATEPIRYFSTNDGIFGTPDLEARISRGEVQTAGLDQAIMETFPSKGGLFMPTRLPHFSIEDIERMRGMSYTQIFVRVMRDFFEGVLPESTLIRIANGAYTFKPYIERISDTDTLVGLDEGPMAAFKDFAAQVLFPIVVALMKEEPIIPSEFRRSLKEIERMLFIVATSGDTGGSMGSACYGMDKMWMTILHSADIPGHVSDMQAKQMEFDGNIYTIRVNTNFDGCQNLAKRLIAEPELKHMRPNSANSLNIGRLLPQIVYYFYSYLQSAGPGEEVRFSVPSGNFGNATAGLTAMKMGLPAKFIIGVNENDVFERFYRTGRYEPAESVHTSPSTAMNVNEPSNVMRLLQFYDGQLVDGKIKVMPDMRRLREDISAYRISDEETDYFMLQFHNELHKIGLMDSTLEPHTAVGWGGGKKYREETGYKGKIITFRTAHPGKFPERMEKLGIKGVVLPENLAKLVDRPHGRHYIVKNDYPTVLELIKALHTQEKYRAA